MKHIRQLFGFISIASSCVSSALVTQVHRRHTPNSIVWSIPFTDCCLQVVTLCKIAFMIDLNGNFTKLGKLISNLELRLEMSIYLLSSVLHELLYEPIYFQIGY